jgi:hemerythrin superfamily protein
MTTSKAKPAAAQDAIGLLMADHKQVKQLFKDFEELKEEGSKEEKSAVVEQICYALTIHAQIEEEIFYPAVRKAIEDADLMDEALVEHAGAKELIAQLQEMDLEDDLYDAKVTVLGEQIDHHVEEEEGDMFPKAKKAKVDTEQLGAKLLKRKEALMGEIGITGGKAEAGSDEEESEVEQTAPPKRSASKR